MAFQYYDGIAPANGDSYSTLDQYYDAVEIPPNSELTYLAVPSTLPYLDFTRSFNSKVPTMRARDYDLLNDGKYEVAEQPDYSSVPREQMTNWHSDPNMLGVAPYMVRQMSRPPMMTKEQKMKMDKLRKKMMAKKR
jgi:hypothetical protein